MNANPLSSVWIRDFHTDDPPFMKAQSESLEWLSAAYAVADSSGSRDQAGYRRLLGKVAAQPEQIGHRGHYASEFSKAPAAKEDLVLSTASLEQRNRFFETAVFERLPRLLRADERITDLLHVTCTGYVSPSPTQRWISQVSSSKDVHNLHLYHMGCYAAIPALRQAVMTASQHAHFGADRRVAVVHSELCTLHFDPRDPTAEDMVIQSLFADGICSYRVSTSGAAVSGVNGFQPVGFHEELIPNSEAAMTWEPASMGFQMTLSKDVPSLVAQDLKAILVRGYGANEVNTWSQDSKVVWAVHPGGPKILDLVQDQFQLHPDQLKHSRAILKRRGNMSSATLPFIWNEILNDPRVRAGTSVISMAFGPGLTVTTVLLRKTQS